VKSANWITNWIRNYNTRPTAENPVSVKPIEEKMKRARQWADEHDRPMHVGEFGCYVAADPESRQRFYTAFREVLDRHDLAWAVWDWKAGFRYWDESKNSPAPGMRQALFGK